PNGDRAEWVTCLEDLVNRAGKNCAGNERLVSLNIEDHLRAGVFRERRDLRHTVRCGGVIRVGDHYLCPDGFQRLSDSSGIGGDNDSVSDSESRNALPDALNNRATGEQLQRLVGEPRGRETRGYHRQNRQVASAEARGAAAKFIPK